MTFFHDWTIAEPAWFWAFWLLPILVGFFLLAEKARRRLLQKLVAARLQGRLAGTVSVGKRRLRFLLLLLGLAAAVFSLARPQAGFILVESKTRGRDVLIAIDCSRSMLATDVAPSRLARAKLAAQDLIAQLPGDRVGLIAFAGTAFLQAPLTIDHQAVLDSLAELDTETIPQPGTNIAAAIKESIEAFGKGESASRALVLFTDGEELDEDGVKAAAAQKDALKIFAVGLGSSEGSLLPLPADAQSGESGGFVKDENGNIVKSRLDESRLRAIAEAAGGFYLRLQNGPLEMQEIVRRGLAPLKEQDQNTKITRHPIERYQWPLALAFALLAASLGIGERRARRVGGRRATVSAALLVLWFFGVPPTILAGPLNPGVQRFEAQDYAGAYEDFSRQLAKRPSSPELNYDLGTAAYALAKDEEALLAFSKATLSENPRLRVDAETNFANTLFRRGQQKKEKDAKIKDWKDALAHYDEALKIEPKNQRTLENQEIVRRSLEALLKPEPKNEPPKPPKKNPQKDEKKESSKGGRDSQKQPHSSDQKDRQKEDSQSEKDSGEKSDSDQSDKGGQSQKQPGEKDQKESGNGSQNDEKKEPTPQNPGEKSDQQKEAAKETESSREPPSAGSDQAPKPEKNQGQAGQPADKAGDKEGMKPANDQPEKAREGAIQAQNPAGQPQTTPAAADPQAQAAEEAAAAREGKMTPAQAAALLDSLKSEDDHVQLLQPTKNRSSSRFIQDW